MACILGNYGMIITFFAPCSGGFKLVSLSVCAFLLSSNGILYWDPEALAI